MNPTYCDEIRALFPLYLDGAVTGQQMGEIASHLNICPGCARDFAEAQAVQETLATLRPMKAPADLGVRLRVAISHEQARSRSHWMDNFSIQWQNAFQPMLLQLSAGLAGHFVRM